MKKQQRGQALILGMALIAVAGVVFFLIFNSTRAVNEKVQLVNAADATAFSGAQIAARQLNFMAYTNRVMIANEVAIGHMISSQAEVETITNGLANMGGIVGGLITNVFNFFGALVGVNDDSAAAWAQDHTRGFTGAYVLGVSANNAAYSEFIQTEYDALLGINGQEPIVQNAMEAVAGQYVNRPSVEIFLNSTEGYDALADSSDPEMQALGSGAISPELQLCQLIIFATPSAPGSAGGRDSVDDGSGNPLFAECNSMINDGAAATHLGGKDNPFDDAGIMYDVLERSAAAVSAAEWIGDRNMTYDWLFGWDANRSGGTTLEWDTANNRYSWSAGADTIRVRSDFFGIFFSMSGGSLATNDSSTVGQAADVPSAMNLMQSVRMCQDIDCDALNVSDGHQMIQAYPRLNPFSNNSAVITAILTQAGRCNDSWGVDEAGIPIDGFQNDLNRFGNPCETEAQITAVAKAEVYYQTPSGAGAASANLFSPYWNARLSN